VNLRKDLAATVFSALWKYWEPRLTKRSDSIENASGRCGPLIEARKRRPRLRTFSIPIAGIWNVAKRRHPATAP
jgi:hypothetical protein